MKTKEYDTTLRSEHLSVESFWISVDIIVDYINMNVSLVNRDRTNKEWMFVNRSLSYEQSRYNILNAIKEAMDFWFNKLIERQTINEHKDIEKIIALSELQTNNEQDQLIR
jgi:hypothetical protein